ncbi:MAG TPA: S4 domain-containing protein, partial [Tepidisphaeraceae bacterium]
PTEEYEAAIVQSPRDAKVRLAKIIITQFHDACAADLAEKDFLAATHGGQPSEMPEHSVPPGSHAVVALLSATKLCASNSEANRKIREGAVKVDGEKVADPKAQLEITSPRVLQMGSRRFVRLTPA